MDGKKLWRMTNQLLSGISESRELPLSKYYTYQIDHDIKHLEFMMARYKFAAKMIENKENIQLLELGCNHGLGMKFFSQTGACSQMVGVDFDEEAIKWACDNIGNEDISFFLDDFLEKDYRSLFKNAVIGVDAIIAIDVIEHIKKEDERAFLNTLVLNLKKDGIAIIGTPNITMDIYASPQSKLGHVNLFDQKRLYDTLSHVFQNVFIFGMNDEIIHTGFYPMSCYIMALCAGKK